MHINLFVLVAQVFNFLLLLFFLKIFLYDRIIRVMDERERLRLTKLAEADALRKEARDAADNFNRKSRELEEQTAALLEQARQDAEAARAEGLASARRDAEASREEWRELLRRERTAMFGEFRRRATRHMYEAARRAFADLADAPVEQQVVRAFIRRLDGLPEGSRDNLMRAASGTGATVCVRSALPVSPGLRVELEQSLHRCLEDGFPVHYETSPDLIAGIELRVGGYIVAWHLDDYLKTLATQLDEVFRQQVEHV